MKGACKNNLMATSVIYHQSTSAVLPKVMAQKCLLAMTEKLKKIEIRKAYLLQSNRFIKSLQLHLLLSAHN